MQYIRDLFNLLLATHPRGLPNLVFPHMFPHPPLTGDGYGRLVVHGLSYPALSCPARPYNSLPSPVLRSPLRK